MTEQKDFFHHSHSRHLLVSFHFSNSLVNQGARNLLKLVEKLEDSVLYGLEKLSIVGLNLDLNRIIEETFNIQHCIPESFRIHVSWANHPNWFADLMRKG